MSKFDVTVGAAPSEYSCDSIQVLEGLEPVRRRPAMYLGDLADGTALHNVLWALVDSALEQHLAGDGFALSVRLHASGAITVEDDAPGPYAEPQDGHGDRTSPLENLFTRLHAGRYAGRSERLATCAVASANAVSEELVVEVQRAGRIHRLHCRRGLAMGPPELVGRTERTGTRVTLRPDPSIFADGHFDAKRIEDRLRQLAFLNPGLLIDLVDERRGGRRSSFRFRGLADWVARLTEGRSSFPAEPLRLRGHHEGLSVDVALRWTEARRPWIKGFLNQDALGRGSHALGLQCGILRAFKAAAGRHSWPEGEPPLWALRSGLVAVIDIRGPGVHYFWPRREALVDARVMRAVRQVTEDGLRDAPVPIKPLAKAVVALYLELDPWSGFA